MSSRALQFDNFGQHVKKLYTNDLSCYDGCKKTSVDLDFVKIYFLKINTIAHTKPFASYITYSHTKPCASYITYSIRFMRAKEQFFFFTCCTTIAAEL